jgi:hypothetical protein
MDKTRMLNLPPKTTTSAAPIRLPCGGHSGRPLAVPHMRSHAIGVTTLGGVRKRGSP